LRDRIVTLESLYLGRVLEYLMKQAGLHRSSIARQLGWTPDAASRLTRGKRGGQARHVVAWLDACGVSGDLREEILRLSV
jgi:transcriptional regulator with XRE-family HTH domain